ncbi:MAG: 4-hydroxy-tetrahydrodipicolinate synthase [Acidobacteria bacterium]|nr:4-hydroxy-tetrahydrodipicolinate synthase [Acidobacteriota bacterium]
MSNDLKLQLSGVGTALVTPFTKDFQLDEPAVRRLVEFQINNHVDFLVPGGTTGESATLSDEEISRLVDIVVQTTAGRVPVVAGAGGNNTAKVIKLAKQFEKLGAQALLSVTPYYNKPTQEGLFQHYRAVAEATSLPIIVYNVPPRTNVNLFPDTVARLAEIPNIVGIKEASGDISQISEILTRVPSNFLVFSGDDSLTLPVIALGGHGVISVISNELPLLTSQLVHASLEGRFDDARTLHRHLLPLMKANFLETNPGPVKAVLAHFGLIQEVLRLPLVPVHPSTRERLRTLLRELGLVEHRA